MSTPAASDLDEENIENAVVYTPKGYEWVFGLSGSLVDGRKLIPHTDDDGNLTEMVSAMGNYYSKPVTTLIDQTYEVLGYATEREDAADLARDHYETRQND